MPCMPMPKAGKEESKGWSRVDFFGEGLELSRIVDVFGSEREHLLRVLGQGGIFRSSCGFSELSYLS